MLTSLIPGLMELMNSYVPVSSILRIPQGLVSTPVVGSEAARASIKSPTCFPQVSSVILQWRQTHAPPAVGL